MIRDHNMKKEDVQDMEDMKPIDWKARLSFKRKQMQCTHCGWIATQKEMMNRHMAKHHPEDTAYNPLDLDENEFHCKVCQKVVTGLANWYEHRNRHYYKNSLQCSLCGMLFTFKNELDNHQANTHGTVNQKCNLCPPGSQLYNMADLREHIKVTHKESERMCPVADCQKVFRSAASVVRHYRYRHMNYLSYRCKQCNKEYDDQSTLKYHIMWVHEKKKKTIELDPSFYDNPDLMEDYSLTDPNYPTKAIVQAEIEKVRLQMKKES